MNSNFSVLKLSFIGISPHLLKYYLQLLLHSNNRDQWFWHRLYGPQSWKYLLSGPAQKKLANFCPRWISIILVIQDIFLFITYQNVKSSYLPLTSYWVSGQKKPVNITLFSFLNNLLAMFPFVVLFGSLPNPVFPSRTGGKIFK